MGGSQATARPGPHLDMMCGARDLGWYGLLVLLVHITRASWRLRRNSIGCMTGCRMFGHAARRASYIDSDLLVSAHDSQLGF